MQLKCIQFQISRLKYTTKYVFIFFSFSNEIFGEYNEGIRIGDIYFNKSCNV